MATVSNKHKISQLVNSGAISAQVRENASPLLEAILVQLFEWETALKNGSKEFFPEANSTHFKQLMGGNSSNPTDTFIRVKFNDLCGDFRCLVMDRGDLNDLMNKKMLLANSCTHTELTALLNRKIEELLIAASYDFKRLNAVAYVEKSQRHTEIFDLISKNRVIPCGIFDRFLDDTTNEYYDLFSRCDRKWLYNNLTECNLVILTKYYKSISFATVEKLQGIGGIEETAAAMIVQNKLPVNSKVDQLRGGLIIGDEEPPKGMNEKVRDVGLLVNQIGLNIMEGH